MENPAPAVFLYGAPEDYANYRAALTSAGLRPVVSRSLAAALGCEALLLPGRRGHPWLPAAGRSPSSSMCSGTPIAPS